MKSSKSGKIIVYVILIIMAVIMLIPFFWMILTALKTNQESISVSPFYIFPHSGWHFENFATVWKSYNFITLYKNMILSDKCSVCDISFIISSRTFIR